MDTPHTPHAPNVGNLVRMANRIGDFFEAMPERQEAIDGISGHIKRFWEPRMRRQILDHIAAGGEGLHDLVRDAIIEGKVSAPPSVVPN
jgi:formate dehydrogenase subunit delta